MCTLSGVKWVRCDCDILIRATRDITEGLPLPYSGGWLHRTGSVHEFYRDRRLSLEIRLF